MNPRTMVSICAMALLALPALAADLPLYDKDQVAYDGDWLLKRPTQEAQVYRNEAGNEIILSNGLISRTFRTAPNAATVGFDNLVTGEAIIRGVKPEALVSIDGVDYAVGGLLGQPNYAFLRPEWIDALEADPASLQFVGYEVGEPAERMAWNRVRHHAPNLEWPPKGAYLRMDYRMPDSSALIGADGLLPSDLGRESLVEDNFKELARQWKVHQSKAHVRSSFENEGKVGEIYTPANTAVYAERKLSKDTRLVECTINAGTDKSASWGPGLALVWSDDRTVKFQLRPGGNSYDSAAMFGLWDGEKENATAGGRQKLDLSKPWTLRMRIEGASLHCEAMPEGGTWQRIESVRIPKDWGAPERVRVGKDGCARRCPRPSRRRRLGTAAHSPVRGLFRDRRIDRSAEQT